MSQRHKLTRRQFLYLSTLATAGAVASACGRPLTPEVTEPEPTANARGAYGCATYGQAR